MPTDPLSTLALATGGAFLGKFVGPAAESLGKAAWERAQQLGTRATTLLFAVGREPQPVEPKLLLPLAQAASLEADSTLAEKWAALLANAADPAQSAPVQVAFIEIMRQLGLDEVKIIDYIYGDYLLRFGNYTIPSIKQIKADNGLSDEAYNIALDNLVRLRLCVPTYDEFARGHTIGRILNDENRVGSTDLGRAFFRACNPPIELNSN